MVFFIDLMVCHMSSNSESDDNEETSPENLFSVKKHEVYMLWGFIH